MKRQPSLPRRVLLALGAALLGACSDAGHPRSVLLVTFDTTRADRIGCYGFENAGTATIDALAARGVRFGRALTPVPITLPAHASLLTASYPPYHGVRDNGTFVVDPRLNSLAERLQAQGFRTGAYISALPLESAFGLDQGFDHYDEQRASDARGEHMNERRGGATVDRALVWLGDIADDDAFFLWVHLFDPHFPYDAPGEVDPTHDAYQAEISYADAQLGRLVQALEAQGRADDTLIVMTSDHGESLGEHGEISHGHLLYDGTQHVPLVMAGAGLEAGRVVEAEVSLVDVAPTITDWLGIDAPEFRAHGGRSLHGLLQGAPDATLVNSAVYMETILPRLHSGWSELYGVEQGGWKYVTAPGAARAELFDLARGEGVELSASEPARAAELAALLAKLRADLPPLEPFESRAIADADPSVIEGLAALGYLGIDHTATASDAPGADPRLVIGARSAAERLRHALETGDAPSATTELAALRALDPGGLLDAEFSGLYAINQDPPDYAAARESYARATQLAPGRRNLWVQLTLCQMELGDPAAALTSIQRAKALAPPTERILALESILLAQTGAR